jgi:hypothetical protein
MMICKEAIRHVSCEDIEQLSWRQRRALKKHLKKCAPCHDYADQIRTIRCIFRRKTKGIELSEAELDQLKSSILECLPEEED